MGKKSFTIYVVVCMTLFLGLIFGDIYYSNKAINKMDNAKIEYKLGHDTEMPDLFGGWKEVYWRVSNDELKWYLKPHNGWKKAYFVGSGYVWCSSDVPDGELDATKYTLFNTKQFKKLKDECHTLGEMKEHNRKADEEYEKCNYKLRMEKKDEEKLDHSKKMWEDALNS